MTEKPILFNTEMVRAILDGRKTETRRVVKPQPEAWMKIEYDAYLGLYKYSGMFLNTQMPFAIGDVLWVRETWAEMPYGYVYRADCEEPEGWDADDKWRPSIHMPRKAARIFLRVTRVCVQRLNDMDKFDMLDEGLSITLAGMFGKDDIMRTFITLWNSTVKKDDLPLYGWDANPWVWVIGFERIEEARDG